MIKFWMTTKCPILHLWLVYTQQFYFEKFLWCWWYLLFEIRTPVMSILFLVIIMLIRVASIKMTVLWNESITVADLWVYCLCYCGSHNKFVCVYSRMKGISVCCLTNNCEQLLIGTEIGNIYILDLNSFKLLDQIIYQDVVMQKSV